VYDYYCEQNGRTVEVRHALRFRLRTWGEVCYAAQLPLGDTDPLAPVRRLLAPPHINVPIGNSRLKEAGFTKLVKRDQGVYENVTALDDEARYMKAGDASTLPRLDKKIGD
jgi:hypothetical protein